MRVAAVRDPELIREPDGCDRIRQRDPSRPFMRELDHRHGLGIDDEQAIAVACEREARRVKGHDRVEQRPRNL
jgi:hypothetical protein